MKPVIETVVASPSLGSRMCGFTCSIGTGIKAIIRALVPAWETIKTVPAIMIMMMMPIILNESCTKVCISFRYILSLLIYFMPHMIKKSIVVDGSKDILNYHREV